MANPQIENGYTRIANEILEQISKTNLNGTQLRIVMVVWRYTYGFRQSEHELSNSFIAQAIGIKNKAAVVRELNALIKGKIITVVGNGSRKTKVLKFNKNYEEWTDCTPVRDQSQLVSNRSTELVSTWGTELVSSRGPNKEIIKEKVKKNTRQQKTFDEESTFYKMAKYFHDKVSIVAKDAGVEHLVGKANLQKWADDFRKLIEKDKVDKRLAKDVMDWVVTDPFWKTNILSAKKLRERFTDLAIKMKSSKNPKQPISQKQIDPLDREIEFQRWVQEGNDPDAFDYRK
jgi:phage replication O-like protein O